jgi:hypothetical protein
MPLFETQMIALDQIGIANWPVRIPKNIAQPD